jgi:hypothetical protein
MKILLCSLAALILFAAAARADNIKCTIKAVGDNKVTVTIDDKDKTFDLAKDAKIVAAAKKNKTKDVPGGLTGLKVGSDATITTEKVDDKVVVTNIQVAAAKKKKKNQ